MAYPDSENGPEDLYTLHMPRLVEYGVDVLNLPQGEAEQLAEQILLAALHQLSTIPDVPAWLEGAMEQAVRRTK